MPTVKDELLQKDIEAYYKADADLKAGLIELTPEAAQRALIDFAIAVREGDSKLKDSRFTELLREFGATIRSSTRLEIPNSNVNGIYVRSACRSGIVTDLNENDVGDMLPWQVIQLAQEIVDKIVSSFEIPKA